MTKKPENTKLTDAEAKLAEWLSREPFEGLLQPGPREDLQFLNYPLGDVAATITEVFMGLARKSAELDAAGHPDPLAAGGDPNFVTLQLPISIPFSKAMLNEVEDLEAKMIADAEVHKDCDKCRERATAHGVKPCHGVYKKGDLLKALIGGLMTLAMHEITGASLSSMRELKALSEGLQGSGVKMEPKSASEIFNPVVRGEAKIKVLH